MREFTIPVTHSESRNVRFELLLPNFSKLQAVQRGGVGLPLTRLCVFDVGTFVIVEEKIPRLNA